MIMMMMTMIVGMVVVVVMNEDITGHNEVRK